MVSVCGPPVFPGDNIPIIPGESSSLNEWLLELLSFFRGAIKGRKVKFGFPGPRKANDGYRERHVGYQDDCDKSEHVK